GWTALHIAAERERLAFALALINAGADIEAQDDLGQTPLHRAAWVGREKMVKFLLDAGADKGKGETTALHLACRSGHASVVRVLLEEKADPDLGDEKGVTPL
ncbi:ankyrin repeat protein, partial [Ascobolus immersus RN42]